MAAKYWTYSIDPRDGRHTLNMPRNAAVVEIDQGPREALLLVFVDEDAPLEPREFWVVSVDSPLPNITLGYIGKFYGEGKLKFIHEVKDKL